MLNFFRLFATPWTVSCQNPLSMEFSRQEYWSGLPFPSPGDLPKPGPEPGAPALQADSLLSEPPGKPMCVYSCVYIHMCVHIYICVCVQIYIYNDVFIYVKQDPVNRFCVTVPNTFPRNI